MSNAAIGPITARYLVSFVVGDDRKPLDFDPSRIRTLAVALTENYTTYEDIRDVVRFRVGVSRNAVVVVGTQLLPAAA